jgi:FixJ family two-component response regulator
MTVADATLTNRQREVVQLLLDGVEVGAIALQLRCTEATVRKHIEMIAGNLPGPHKPMRRILVYGAAMLAEGE